jgi:hypothetical protein
MGTKTLQISYPEDLLETLGKTPEEFELENQVPDGCQAL